MEKKRIGRILRSLYEPALEEDTAWDSYSNFIDLFLDGDPETTHYLMTICELDKGQRLHLRHKIAEKGFELTPCELNQYILLIMLALSDYIELTEEFNSELDF
jgi:hypothetical protein